MLNFGSAPSSKKIIARLFEGLPTGVLKLFAWKEGMIEGSSAGSMSNVVSTELLTFLRALGKIFTSQNSDVSNEWPSMK